MADVQIFMAGSKFAFKWTPNNFDIPEEYSSSYTPTRPPNLNKNNRIIILCKQTI